MTRKDLQTLAKLRLKEAKILVRAGCPQGGYYLAGYGAECALKACIAKQTARHEFPDLKRVKDSWVHDLKELLKVARLERLLKEDEVGLPGLNANWQIVREWNEQSRYQQRSHAEAQALIAALEDGTHGVFTWLKRHW